MNGPQRRQIHTTASPPYHLVLGMFALSAIVCCTEDTASDHVDDAVRASIHDAATDSKVISSGDLTVTLESYNSDVGKHPIADNLGLTGGTSATISRNHKPVVVLMPLNGSYSISIFNPNSKEEMIATVSIDANTGYLTAISYSGRTANGDWFNAFDGNVDGQPETVINYDKEENSRIWIHDRWRQIVRHDGNAGVILDGKWQRVRRDPKTLQYELSEPSE